MMDNPYLDPNFEKNIKTLPEEIQKRFLDPGPRGLTILQTMARPVIRWFFYGQAGSGRSWLLAHIFINRAIETKEPVWIFNHFSTHLAYHDMYMGQRNMLATIIAVMKSQYPEYDYSYNTGKAELTVKKREK